MRFLIIALLIGSYTVNAQVDSFPYFANHTDDISTITYSPNGKYVVSGSWDATIAVQTTDRLGTLVHREENYQGAINSIAFSRDNNWFIAGGQDGILNKYEFNDSFFSILTLDTSLTISEGQINKLIYGPGMRTIFCASHNGKFLTYDLAKDKVMPIDVKRPISAAAVALDRMSYFIATDGGAEITQYDIFGKLLRTFSGHTNEVTDMLVTLDRKFLISSSKDKTIRIWNIATGKEEHQFTDHTWAVTDIDMDAFGLYLVSGGLDGVVNVYSLKDRTKLKSVALENHKVNAVSLSPDLTKVAAAAQPKGVSNPAGYFAIPTDIASRKVKVPKTYVVKKIKQAPKASSKKKVNTTTISRSTAATARVTKPKKSGTVIKKTDQIEIRIEDEK